MTRSGLIFLLPLALVVYFSSIISAAATDSLLIMGPSSRKLGTNNEFMETPYYKASNFGFFGAISNEQHGVWYYPTPNDYNEPGYFNLDVHNAAIADLNGDGLDDLVIAWGIFPHVIERHIRATFTILINEGNGSMRYAPEIFGEAGPVNRFFAYRTFAEDLNMDGRPDIIAASMGMIKRNPDGTYSTEFEPIPLMLSTPEGILVDASANIEGQEEGGLPPGFTFGHELSVGDVNGDGFPDFFTGKLLFINDGSGRFTNATHQLPEEMKPPYTYLMHSIIGDLNGDGIGDIVAAYADGETSHPSGYVLMSNGNNPIHERKSIQLPQGRYGAGNTKFNHGVIYDVNQDGIPDIVFSVTRAVPYYKGRTLQIIINRGNGVFEEATDQYLEASEELETAQGEGSVFVVDVNGNGILDIVHSGSNHFDPDLPPGMIIYINDNGKLRMQATDKMAWIQPWQIENYEGFREYAKRPLTRAYPIDLDGVAGIDFVANVQIPLSSWPQQEPNEYIFYSILAKEQITKSTDIPAFSEETSGILAVYPNPFNISTQIQFMVNTSGKILLSVLDIMGRKLESLYEGFAQAGIAHQLSWNGSGQKPGIYFIRLQSNEGTFTRKIILTK